jgi:predicted DCC family thiol-disulfide oxidoreductase YuxK
MRVWRSGVSAHILIGSRGITLADKLEVYYDGACPLCAREMAVYQRRAAAAPIKWVDIGSDTGANPGTDLSRQEALARLHVRLADGTLVSGAAAFIELWRHVPGFGWLSKCLAVPPFGFLAEMAYRAFLVVRKLWR